MTTQASGPRGGSGISSLVRLQLVSEPNGSMSQKMIEQSPRSDLGNRRKDRQKLIKAAKSRALPLTIKVILSPLRAGEDWCKCKTSVL